MDLFGMILSKKSIPPKVKGNRDTSVREGLLPSSMNSVEKAEIQKIMKEFKEQVKLIDIDYEKEKEKRRRSKSFGANDEGKLQQKRLRSNSDDISSRKGNQKKKKQLDKYEKMLEESLAWKNADQIKVIKKLKEKKRKQKEGEKKKKKLTKRRIQ